MVEFFTPQDTLDERAARDKVPLELWVRQGFLVATPGSEIRYAMLAERLGQIAGRAKHLRAVVFDRYRIRELRLELDDQGVWLPLHEHPQGVFAALRASSTCRHSVATIEGALLERRLLIRENPVLTWNAANAMTESDRQLNRVFTKKKSTGRIDGIVALTMAIGCGRALAPAAADGCGFLMNGRGMPFKRVRKAYRRF